MLVEKSLGYRQQMKGGSGRKPEWIRTRGHQMFMSRALEKLSNTQTFQNMDLLLCLTCLCAWFIVNRLFSEWRSIPAGWLRRLVGMASVSTCSQAHTPHIFWVRLSGEWVDKTSWVSLGRQGVRCNIATTFQFCLLILCTDAKCPTREISRRYRWCFSRSTSSRDHLWKATTSS